jgi:hypothetical protein
MFATSRSRRCTPSQRRGAVCSGADAGAMEIGTYKPLAPAVITLGVQRLDREIRAQIRA